MDGSLQGELEESRKAPTKSHLDAACISILKAQGTNPKAKATFDEGRHHLGHRQKERPQNCDILVII